MKAVGVPFVKKDAKALVTGKPVYTNDLAPKDCLIVKLLRSPHANAMIQEIKTDVAMRVPGIEAIYTWKDVPQQRFTIAGQTWPEPSPYDRLILDQHVRFVGDPVAIIAGENEACVERAMKMIKVKYEVLPAVLDPEEALDGPILVHPEDSWKALCTGRRWTWGCRESSCRMRCCCRTYISCQSGTAGNDGTISDGLLYGYVWKTECDEFYADRLPCAPYCFQCTWHTKIQDPCV